METLKQRIEKANKIIKDNLHQKTSEIIFLCRETFIDTSTLLVFIENHRKNEVN